MLLSRWLYYLSSIPTLLLGVKNWPRLALALLKRRAAEPIEVQLRSGLRFRVRTLMDVWIVKETCLDRQYERASVTVEDGWTVIDIGAALGDFAIGVAKAHPRSKVYAYEPFPESFALLQDNLALNRVENVTALPYAIGAQDSAMALHVLAEAVQHTTVAGRVSWRDSVSVQTITLDRAFADQGLSRCDYLKVDCEGAEYDIFFNTRAAALQEIKHICLEYHDGVTQYSHHDLVRFFEENGFQVKCAPSPVHRHLGLMYAVNSALKQKEVEPFRPGL